MKILILCTGNSCRSQMAEGFLKSFNSALNVYSAGTHPAKEVNPFAIRVMMEAGIDISNHKTRHVDTFIDLAWNYVITVCDDANETCPIFSGTFKNRLHIGFEDPAKAVGSDTEKLAAFRKVRDEIQEEFYRLYIKEMKYEI
jgi:arsenate reductase (thioredoxin)